MAAVAPQFLDVHDARLTVILYGRRAVRKTTTAVSAPSPFVFNAEGSAAFTRPGLSHRLRGCPIRSSDAYRDTLAAVFAREDGYQCESLVIDTATVIEQQLRAELTTSDALDRWSYAVAELYRPLFDPPVHVMITAHAREEWVEAPAPRTTTDGYAAPGSRVLAIDISDVAEYAADVIIWQYVSGGRFFSRIVKSRVPWLREGRIFESLGWDVIAGPLAAPKSRDDDEVTYDTVVALHREAGLPHGSLSSYLRRTHRAVRWNLLDGKARRGLRRELQAIAEQRRRLDDSAREGTNGILRAHEAGKPVDAEVEPQASTAAPAVDGEHRDDLAAADTPAQADPRGARFVEFSEAWSRAGSPSGSIAQFLSEHDVVEVDDRAFDALAKLAPHREPTPRIALPATTPGKSALIRRVVTQAALAAGVDADAVVRGVTGGAKGLDDDLDEATYTQVLSAITQQSNGAHGPAELLAS